MSMRSPLGYSLPDETARVARAAFPRGNPYLRIADALGPLFHNPDFADLYSHEGQPAEDPAQLALVTIFQFAEGLSDRQAADAVRSRIDWKYALCLPLDDAGFDASVLCEFRRRLLAEGAEARLFTTLLQQCREVGLVRARGRQRTDSTHVLAAIHTLNRLELVGGTFQHALHALAAVVPAWLRQQSPAEWADHYGRRLEEYRLPQEAAARQALAAQIGVDGLHLLQAVWAPTAPAWLWHLPAVETLRQVWVQQYAAPEGDGRVAWRPEADLPPSALRIASPHDPEARYSVKRETQWVGYKVHLTETCDADTPHLLTDVQTTAATTVDSHVLPAVHTALKQADLLPGEHLVDPGYVDADNLVTSQDQGIDLVGPALSDNHWQAKTDGAFTLDCFTVDWEQRAVHCPQGHPSRGWSETTDPLGNTVITARFAPAACAACPCRAQCTRSAQGPRRVTLRPQAQHQALRATRARQTTPEFAEQYAPRAGIEGTLSQGVRTFDLREARYIGLAKTRLQHLLTATAMNVARLAAWLAEIPLATTRRSPLAILAAPSCASALPT